MLFNDLGRSTGGLGEVVRPLGKVDRWSGLPVDFLNLLSQEVNGVGVG